jgi:hypothetical protein
MTAIASTRHWLLAMVEAAGLVLQMLTDLRLAIRMLNQNGQAVATVHAASLSSDPSAIDR